MNQKAESKQEAKEPVVEIPSIAKKRIEWKKQQGALFSKGSYELGELLDYMKFMDKQFGLKSKIDTEQRTVHSFHRKSQSERCMTIVAPLSDIKSWLNECANLKVAPVFQDPVQAVDFELGRKKYNIADYVDYIVDGSPNTTEGAGMRSD